jgi:Predicted metal-binding protein (DUF2103)
MRHRGSGKIKRQHSIIKGLYKLLQSIENWGEIQSIIPGRISPSTNITQLHLTVQYATTSSIRCLAKGGVCKRSFSSQHNQIN